ncbi:hypothetical protein CL3_21230 [butyrate-producing bacterium SM4/1]|nr:hypothetical protein CL3_21230 [butyrate-producing bacterium SM4/1]
MAVSGSVLPCFFANFLPLLTGPSFRILFRAFQAACG